MAYSWTTHLHQPSTPQPTASQLTTWLDHLLSQLAALVSCHIFKPFSPSYWRVPLTNCLFPRKVPLVTECLPTCLWSRPFEPGSMHQLADQVSSASMCLPHTDVWAHAMSRCPWPRRVACFHYQVQLHSYEPWHCILVLCIGIMVASNLLSSAPSGHGIVPMTFSASSSHKV